MVTTRTRQFARPALAVFASIGVLGALSACAPAEADEAASTGTTAPSTAPSAEASTDAGGPAEASSDAAAGAYNDGSYDAEGSYQSPGGNESIKVSITLADDVVTDVTVTPEATSGNAAQYQKAFAGGIGEVVVGKKIDDLEVSKVAGSSLTSGGFNDALETIKADAAA
jgi:uncharacterized protein with FMN-binding domain